MKALFSILLILSCCLLQAQTLELSTGINLTKYYKLQNRNQFNSRYDLLPKNLGYNWGAGYESEQLSWLKFTLNYTNYVSEFKTWDGGNGGRTNSQAKVQKTILSLDFYPMAIRAKKLELDLGFSFAALINHKTDGTNSGFYLEFTESDPQLIAVSWNEDIIERYEQFHTTFYFGLIGRISYNVPISEGLDFFPFYSYYLGITKEFLEFPKPVRSMRNTFGLGISKRIGSK